MHNITPFSSSYFVIAKVHNFNSIEKNDKKNNDELFSNK